MNLTTKVLLTFAIVIAVALAAASILIGRSAGAAYRGYMTGYMRQQMPGIAAEAGAIYERTGSWEAAQQYVDEASGGQMRGRRGQGAARQTEATQFLIVDPSTGQALAGQNAPKIPQEMLASGTPIPVAGEILATIVSIGIQPGLGQAEQALLDEVNRAILLSAMIAGLIALVLGGLLIYSILRPLRKLEAGVARVSGGDLDARVAVSGKDEISRLAQDFNRMAENLQKEETLRQHMMADIAHELRTPLSVVQGNLQAILDGVYPLELAEIESVYAETELLARLISDLHELARAEAGQLSLTMQSVHVDEVVDHMVGAFQPMAQERNIELQSDSGKESLMVQADPDRLRQILYNLIGNAVRHTPEGGSIGVGAYARETKLVRFWVRNSGPAIERQELAYVFDRFYRVRSQGAMSSEYTANAGLGLTIAKALVEAHGGEIGVTSQSQEGTIFWFELPAYSDGT